MGFKRNIIAMCLPFLLSSCVGNIDKTNATELDKYSESTIKTRLIVGTTTKKDTLILLGVPTQPQDYNSSDEWVYKSSRKDWRMYFFIPFNNNKQQKLSLDFDKKGILSTLKYKDYAK